MTVYKVYLTEFESRENSSEAFADEVMSHDVERIVRFFKDEKEAIAFYETLPQPFSASKLHYVVTVYSGSARVIEAGYNCDDDCESLEYAFETATNRENLKEEISAPYMEA